MEDQARGSSKKYNSSTGTSPAGPLREENLDAETRESCSPGSS